MKKFVCFLVIFSTLSLLSTAQTFINRNADERFAKTLVTTDSAGYHYIDSLIMQPTEAGVVEVSVVGLSADGYAVTGILKARYINHAGTLTVGSSTNDLAVVTDSQLSGATFDIYTEADANKCYIRIKGKVNKTIRWYSIVKRKSVYN